MNFFFFLVNLKLNFYFCNTLHTVYHIYQHIAVSHSLDDGNDDYTHSILFLIRLFNKYILYIRGSSTMAAA
jgi:hypothetical protein